MFNYKTDESVINILKTTETYNDNRVDRSAKSYVYMFCRSKTFTIRVENGFPGTNRFVPRKTNAIRRTFCFRFRNVFDIYICWRVRL